MRKIVLAIAILCLAPTVPKAEDVTTYDWSRGWSRGDTYRQLAFSSIVLVDWSQTIDFTQNKGLSEMNPILGEHPSRARINTLIPLAILGHAAVSYMLPKGDLRGVWQSVFISLEIGAVSRNVIYGAGVAVPWG